MEELVNSWIKATEIGTSNPEYEAHEWAVQEVLDLHLHGKYEEVWQIILSVIAATDTEWVLKCIGAGPLEDLLTHRAAEFIDRVATQVEASPKFKTALAEVWLDEQDTPLYRRLYEMAGVEPPFDEPATG